MAVWLLTWNPDKWHWEDYDERCEEASVEHPIIEAWSCQSKKVQVGDEFFLIKLGKPPRGILGHGIIIEANFEDVHWDDERADKTINYIEGEWDTLLNYKTQDILDASILDERCPEQFWHPQASGTRIKDEVLPTLRELWAAVTKTYPANPEESVYHPEGAARTLYTTTYERDAGVRRAFLKGKHLKCEVCGFDFEEVYGKLGAGYIEVHHKKPVSEGERITDLNNDLVMLCSNCHRMIHRGRDHMITPEELGRIICANMKE